MKIETAKKLRAVSTVLFVLYLILLFYVLFFSEQYGRIDEREYSYNLTLFKEIKRFWTYREQLGSMTMFLNIYGNVLCFVPFGAILPILNRRTRHFVVLLVLSFELCLMVECVQLITKVGTFDVDDLLLNTLGGILGYLVFKLCNYWRKKIYG